MILSRVLSFGVRGLEFLISATLLGIVGHFLYRYDANGEGPHGRMIFAECVAAVSTFLSLIWLVPFTWTFMHYRWTSSWRLAGLRHLPLGIPGSAKMALSAPVSLAYGTGTEIYTTTTVMSTG